MRRAGPEVEHVKKTSMGSGAGSRSTRRPPRFVSARNYTPHLVYELWLIGIGAGIGVALGLAAAGAFARSARAPIPAGAGGLIGWLFLDWKAGAAGAIAGVLSGFGAGTFARGAVRRGGTSGGTAAIFGVVAVLALALSFIPIVGFIEAIAIPVVGLRSRQRAGEKYAGLRTLAK